MIQPNSNRRAINLTLFIVGLFAFAYTTTRAYLLSITWDESYTFLIYVREGFTTFKEFDRLSANNHLLNTWLMELTSRYFGISELALRLPNLFGHLLFLVFSARLARKLSSPILIIGTFLILNLNPFLLDFFSLARGYGLSIGLMMGSLYFAFQFIESKGRFLSAVYSGLFAIAAVLANLSLLHYFIIANSYFLILHIVRNYKEQVVNNAKRMKIVFGQSVILLLPFCILFYVVPLAFNLRNAGALYFGGSYGFWKDTVGSLIIGLLYDHPFMLMLKPGLEVGTAMILIFSFCFIVFSFKRNRIEMTKSYLLFIAGILLLCFATNYLLYRFIGLVFLKERTALFYFPLFILLMAFLFDQVSIRYSKVFNSIFTTITIFFAINFLLNANLHHVVQWRREADTRKMFKYLMDRKDQLKDHHKTYTLCIPMHFMPDFDYYQILYDLNWLNKTVLEKSSGLASDYIFMEKKDLTMLPSAQYEILQDYPKSKMILLSGNVDAK